MSSCPRSIRLRSWRSSSLSVFGEREDGVETGHPKRALDRLRSRNHAQLHPVLARALPCLQDRSEPRRIDEAQPAEVEHQAFRIAFELAQRRLEVILPGEVQLAGEPQVHGT